LASTYRLPSISLGTGKAVPYPKKEKADDESAVADSSPLPKRKTGPCQRQVNLDFASFAAFPSHTLPSHELKINRINRMTKWGEQKRASRNGTPFGRQECLPHRKKRAEETLGP